MGELRWQPVDLRQGPYDQDLASYRIFDGRRASTLHRRPGRLAPLDAPSTTVAVYTHYATLVGAFVTWAWLDRRIWFFGDEWSFLTQRGVFYSPGDPRSIWYPHNEHWSTLPVLLWRGIYNIWHLGSYWPYLTALLVAHVAVMHLVWRLCRRAHVDIWVATVSVALLGWLGAGAEDLAWAFQVGFVGSVALGYLALELLDRPIADTGAGPSLRDWAGSIALLGSLMCSTIGDAMLVAGAVVVFARRTKQRALRVLALPVTSYVIWWVFIGRSGTTSDNLSSTTVTGIPGYIWTGLSTSLGQAFNLEAAGAALLVGIAAWVIWNSRLLWLDSPALVGLAAAAVTFFLLAGLGRDDLGSAVPARYVYIAIAILLPLLARLASSVAAWAPAKAAVLGLLGLAIVGNLGQASAWVDARNALVGGLKTEALAAARLLSRGTRDVAGPLAKPLRYEPNLTAAWLAHAESEHLLPSVRLSKMDLVNARTAISTALTGKPVARGRLQVIGTSYAVVSQASRGCRLFAPEVTSPPMEVWLRVPAGSAAGSVELVAPPAAPGTVNFVAAVLAPRHAPASSVAAELSMPPGGSAYLAYNDSGAKLALLWDVGTPLTICGATPVAPTKNKS